MVFSPDGKWLGIGGRNEIKLWNLNAEEFDSRRIPVGDSSMEFSSDSSLLAMQAEPKNIPNSSDEEILVWNLRDVSPRGTVRTSWELRDFAFTSDSRQLVVGNEDSGVFVEPFDASWALEHVCGIVGRNLTHEEWNKYQAGSDYVATCPP
jgi:WD40 repeat protein